jgi:ankyrin repeat protein
MLRVRQRKIEFFLSYKHTMPLEYKLAYELIDMVLFETDDITTSALLHRSWISKKIVNILHRRQFFNAIKNDDFHIVKILSDLYKPLISDALDYASKLGKLDIVKYLYSIGAEPSHLAILDASKQGHLELVKYLYDIDDGYKTYAIHEACKRGHLDIVKFLYFNDNDVYYGTENICYDDIFICYDIKYTHVNNGYDSDDDNGYNNSFDNAIFLAMRNGHFDVVKFLHSNGVKCGSLILDWLVFHGRLHYLKFLHDIGVSFTSYAINLAIECGQFEIIRYLHSIGVEFDDESMHIANQTCHLDIIKFVHEIGNIEYTTEAKKLLSEYYYL